MSSNSRVDANDSDETICSYISVWLCIDDIVGSTRTWFQENTLHSLVYQYRHLYSINEAGSIFSMLFSAVQIILAGFSSLSCAFIDLNKVLVIDQHKLNRVLWWFFYPTVLSSSWHLQTFDRYKSSILLGDSMDKGYSFTHYTLGSCFTILTDSLPPDRMFDRRAISSPLHVDSIDTLYCFLSHCVRKSLLHLIEFRILTLYSLFHPLMMLSANTKPYRLLLVLFWPRAQPNQSLIPLSTQSIEC